jgi:hypothetical protein
MLSQQPSVTHAPAKHHTRPGHSHHITHTTPLQEGEAGLQGSDARRLRELLARCGLMASERPRASFSAKHLEGELGKLSKAGTAEQHRWVGCV